jgi:ubiquinone/menaquinone biosynthesis C-methylase UbiE
VVEGVADALPLDDASMDAGVVTAVLCSVADPAAALGELHRVIRLGGELRFFEHVAADTPGWRGCSAPSTRRSGRGSTAAVHTHRHTEAAIRAAGFEIEDVRPLLVPAPTASRAPVAPRILGRARRPA